jgi:predicted transposase YbfD/YdcC
LPKKTFYDAVSQGADCVIQLKGNQKTLFEAAKTLGKEKPQSKKVFNDKGHGRVEKRTVKIYPFDADMPFVRTLVVVEREILHVKQKRTSTETAYYLSTKEIGQCTVTEYQNLIRGHWGGIENRNHWRRDAIFKEDNTRSHNPNICGAIGLLTNVIISLLDRLGGNKLNFGALIQQCARSSKTSIDIILNGRLPKKI